MGEKFKPGDIVYHKATWKRGVLSGTSGTGSWVIAWQDGKKGTHNEVELWTPDEYEKESQPE